MRTWRVGSFSMGAALLLLGVFLLLAQVFKWGDPAFALLSWWPAIFIILGIEVIIYLARHKQENIKYDLFSIVFIAIIGTFGLGMAMLSASGLLELAGNAVKAEVQTASLPAYAEKDLNGVHRVVVDAGPYLSIETTTEKAVSLFGTYQEGMATGKNSIEKASDYVLAEKKGDTLFLKMKELPHQRFGGYRSDPDATLLIPSDLELDVKGGNHLTLKPRGLKQNWSIDSSGIVELKVEDQEDINIQAKDANELRGDDWKDTKQQSPEEEDGLRSGRLTFGKGTNTISIYHATTVEVN